MVPLTKRFGTPAGDHARDQPPPPVLQLGGNDPQAIEACVSALINDFGYDFPEINLNCGCPSIEAGGAADFGASLMKQPDVTHDAIHAIHRGCQSSSSSSISTTVVSLKCRTAVFETVDEMEAILLGGPPSAVKAWKDQQFQTLCKYLSHAQAGGMEHVIVHARPAVLAGLSSTKNRWIPPLDYDLVEQVAREFPNVRVTLNGGIKGMEDLDNVVKQQHQQQQHGDCRVASHMAGRWMLQRPLELAVVQSKYLTTDDDEDDDVVVAASSSNAIFATVMDRYMQFVVKSLDRQVHSLHELCLPLYLMIEELREEFDDDPNYDESVCSNQHLKEAALEAIMPCEEECYGIMKDALEQLSDVLPSSKKAKVLPVDVNWKKLSTFLKNLVGTKVYNKWKRNRSELVS